MKLGGKREVMIRHAAMRVAATRPLAAHERAVAGLRPPAGVQVPSRERLP